MMHTRVRGSGHPILFLHGMPTSSALWNGVVDRLSSDFQCIAVDLPGLGRSAATPIGFRDLAALAAMLEEIRVQHGIAKWHIVAHDAGCAIAVHYAYRFPDRVGRMSLVTPSMFPELKPYYLFEILRRRVLGELLSPLINVLFWSVVMRVCMKTAHERNGILREFRTPFRGVRGSWRFMSVLRWGEPTAILASVPQLLAQLETPFLIVHGSKDPAVPVAFAHRAAQLTRNSELILLECGHFVPVSEPVALSAAMARFFSGQSATTPGLVATERRRDQHGIANPAIDRAWRRAHATPSEVPAFRSAALSPQSPARPSTSPKQRLFRSDA